MSQKQEEYNLIKKSGLFDQAYYLIQSISARKADMDPLKHFIQYGWKEGRNPSPLFDTKYYLDMNPDVKNANINPLIHFINFGWKEGRNPSPLFDTKYYLDMNPDVKNANINPLIHSIDFGWKEDSHCLLPKDRIKNQVNKISSYNPKVSVIVPNYNHAIYLEERLASIYHQSYMNYEVILLDDCSKDQSRKILMDYQKQYPKITQCIFNESNSGSTFAQWKKGIENATGELIWIAESDDFCDLDFLEKLIPFFSDETVLLGYSHSVFIDEDGQKNTFAFEHYLSDIDRHKWDSSYINTAHNEVISSLGLKNTIPNVSSVVFRRPKGIIAILNNPEWLKMKVCGDWLFYLNFIRGGRIAYCRETNNYYRIYQTSSSKKTHTQDIYYKEHETVACAIATLYNVSPELLSKNYQLLQDFYCHTVKDHTNHHFSQLFNFDKVINCRKNRTPNILMGVYAFAFGGGEVFPIQLANALKEKGNSIIVLAGNFEPINPQMRKMLYPDIPVVNYDSSIDLDALINEYGIEITHSHHASMDRLLSTVRTKHVITMHGMYEMMKDFPNDIKDFMDKIDHWFYTADKNIIPFKKFKLFDQKKFTKINNGMPVPNIDKIDLEEFCIPSDAFIVCLATRALYDKGWFEAIEAIRMARETTNKNIHLLLIGEGPVFDLLKETNIPSYIHLLGYRSNLADYFSVSHLGFLPTYFKGESFPLVMIECFMAGIPIIASNIGEISAMMTIDGQLYGGALIDLHAGKVESDDLALALIKMVNNEEYYQECVNSVKRLKNKFDLAKIAEKYSEVYVKVCK